MRQLLGRSACCRRQHRYRPRRRRVVAGRRRRPAVRGPPSAVGRLVRDGGEVVGHVDDVDPTGPHRRRIDRHLPGRTVEHRGRGPDRRRGDRGNLDRPPAQRAVGRGDHGDDRVRRSGRRRVRPHPRLPAIALRGPRDLLRRGAQLSRRGGDRVPHHRSVGTARDGLDQRYRPDSGGGVAADVRRSTHLARGDRCRRGSRCDGCRVDRRYALWTADQSRRSQPGERSADGNLAGALHLVGVHHRWCPRRGGRIAAGHRIPPQARAVDLRRVRVPRRTRRPAGELPDRVDRPDRLVLRRHPGRQHAVVAAPVDRLVARRGDRRRAGSLDPAGWRVAIAAHSSLAATRPVVE